MTYTADNLSGSPICEPCLEASTAYYGQNYSSITVVQLDTSFCTCYVSIWHGKKANVREQPETDTGLWSPKLPGLSSSLQEGEEVDLSFVIRLKIVQTKFLSFPSKFILSFTLRCAYFTHDSENSWCYLKTAKTAPRSKKGTEKRYFQTVAE